MPKPINKENKNKNTPIIFLITGVLLIIFGLALVFLTINVKKQKEIKTVLGEYACSGCDCIFVSTYDLSGFSPDIFKNCSDDVYIVNKVHPKNSKEMISFLKKCREKNPGQTDCLYLGIDPETFYKSEKDIDLFLEELAAFEGIRIRILYKVHSYEYWKGYDDSEFETALHKYQDLTEKLAMTENTWVFFPGYEEWMIGCKDAYQSDTDDSPVPAFADKLTALCFVDATYMVHTKEEINNIFMVLMDNVRRYSEFESEINNRSLEGEKILFLGDSIFGIFVPPTSIPSLVQTFGKAEVANCGIGGLALAGKEQNLSDLLDGLSKKDEKATKAYNDFLNNRVLDVNAESFAKGSEFLYGEGEGENLTVLVEFGLNDYFTLVPTGDFEKELCDSIDKIRKEKPKADIILVIPGYLNTDGYGDKILGEGGYPLEEYRNILRNTAKSYGLSVFDLTEVLSDKETLGLYTDDGTHYNERGRMLIGEELTKFLINRGK